MLSLKTLLSKLSSIVTSTMRPKLKNAETFTKITRPDLDQARALELLGLRPIR